MDDLQFAQGYGQLVKTRGGGECAVYEFYNEVGAVRSVFLKREIPFAIYGGTYFEAVTPCAYGGPVILSCKEGRRWELVAAFERAFRKYCLEQDIISESVRFHPVLGNAADFAGCYETEFIGETAAIDLRVKNPICDEFTAGCKNMLFKALENGVDYRVTAHPANADHFAELYLSIAAHQNPQGSMDGRLLTEYIEKLGPHLVITEAVYRERTIALSLSRFSGGVLQLEGTIALPEFGHLSPEHVLQYGLTSWGKQHGASFIHLGGGEEFTFKKQFSRNTRFESWAGRKIWNQEAYAKLCDAVEGAPGFEGIAPPEGQTAPLGFSFN
ncbi:MAG TPA: GNAT family N-acetyltransferase [Planococcus sp. (in: firmicutes)]|nr:GNAT family N-acetyltransferase [Planococcus sp. (in: firmicutes)]